MKRSIRVLLAFMAIAIPLPGKASVQVDWVSRYIFGFSATF